ncbi:MAG: hypothetical protein ACRDL4_15730 [Thermoleophilaceae bacterium]
MAVLVLVEVGVAGDGLEGQRGQEQGQEEERQAVVLDERAHCSVVHQAERDEVRDPRGDQR